MEVETGWLEMQSDGCLTGVLRTLTLNVNLELRRTAKKETPATYAVHVAGGWVMGEARTDVGSGTISIVIASPELHGPLALTARPQSGSDEWRMTWTSTV